MRLLIIASLLLPAAAHAGEALEAIRARGVLRVGTTGDYQPFTKLESDGRYTGADIIMAARLATRMGVTVEYVPTAWVRLLPDLQAGRFDIAMGGVSITPARAAAAAFSTVTYVDGKRPVVRCADKDRLISVAVIDQPGVRVIVNPGASNEAFARENVRVAQLTVHPDNATVFEEIRQGRADVMVTDGIEVDHQALIHPDLCPANVAAPFTRLEKAYMLPKDPALVAIVNGWLADEISTGAWPAILDVARRTP